MANYSALKAAIQAVIKTNGAHEITGANMQTALLSIIDSLGNGYQLMGVATPSTTPPSSPDYNIAYIAGAGSYTNFGTSVVIPPTNIAIFKYDGSWTCEQVTVENGGVFDITAYNNNTTYADLTAALGTNGANVPEGVRKGGMSVKYVQSSDNKYVECFLTKDKWSVTEADWEKLNLEEEYANVKKNDLLTCLALTQAQIDSLAKIPRCVKGLGVSPTFTPSGQLYWQYAGKRKGQETAMFSIVDENGTTIDIFNTSNVIDISAKYGLRLFEGTMHRFWFLVDLRDLYQYDDHTGDGNFYDYGQTLPIDFASVQVTDLSKILANNASISELSNLPLVVANKVDKVEGKGLSTNDYTDADKDAVSQLFGETISRSYVKTTGRLSEFIPAKASKEYNISFTSDNVVWPSCRFICYDDSSYLQEEITVNSGETGILETPAGTTRILAFIGTSLSGQTVNVSITIASNGDIDEINAELEDISDSTTILENNTLIGKKIMCFGDSITEFNTAGKGWVEHASALEGDFIRGACGGSRYVPRATATDTPTTNAEAKGNFDITNLVDAWVNNHWTGVDASVEYLEGQHAVSVANLKANPVSNVDMVVIMGGTNDFSSNIPIGEVTDINTTTVLGAIKHCVQVILTANPKIKIYVLSPLVRYFGSDITDRTDANWCDNYANSTGKTTADMVDAQGDVAKYLHVPFCSLYYELGWNQYNFSEYFRDDDNTHPHKGFKVLAERIHSWLTARL